MKESFDTSNYLVKHPLPIEKSKKVFGSMKDELSGKIMKHFVAQGLGCTVIP